jgi:cyclic nucleotide-binding protein
MAVPAHSVVDTRRDQMFPVLEPHEIERVRHFGTSRSYRKGDVLAKAGSVSEGFTIILSGKVDVLQHASSGQGPLIVTHGPGAFMGELAQLAGRPALVDALVAARHFRSPWHIGRNQSAVTALPRRTPRRVWAIIAGENDMRAHQPGSTPIDIPETVPNPVLRPHRSGRRPECRKRRPKKQSHRPILLGGRYAQSYFLADDFEQAKSHVG